MSAGDGQAGEEISPDFWSHDDSGNPINWTDHAPEAQDRVLEWAAPVPFDDFDLPTFPVGALPIAVQPFVQELAVATQTPPDLGAMLTLGALATVTAKRAVVQIKPGYHEPLNLFTAVVLGPGERKSAVLSEVIRPIADWERKAEEAARPRIVREAMLFRVSEKRLAEMESRLARCKSHNEREQLEMEAEQLATEHEKLRVAKAPILLADDCTQEALGSLLHAHGGRMSIMSDEGGVFSLLAGRYSDQLNLDVYLKSHSGSAIRVDRKGRPSEHIEDPALSLGLAVQPGIINKLADTALLRTTGLLARFLYALPRGRIGYRESNPPTLSDAARAGYHDALARMLAFVPSRPIALALDTMAFQAWEAFTVWLEPQLREFESLGAVRDWGSKLPGAVARLAGIFSLVAGRDSVDQETFEQACAVGRYLVPHAVATFGCMKLDEDLEDAKAILRLIHNKKLESFTKRELFIALRGRARFKVVEVLDKPLNLLEQRNFIRKGSQGGPSGKRGRPRSDAYSTHPHTLL